VPTSAAHFLGFQRRASASRSLPDEAPSSRPSLHSSEALRSRRLSPASADRTGVGDSSSPFDQPISDRTSDAPSLHRCSGLCRPYLQLRRALFHARPRVGNARFPKARAPSTQQDPFGRLRTATAPFRAATASYLFEAARDPTASALHPRLSLRARRFGPGVTFAATGFPVRRRLQVSAAQHDPRTRPAVFRSPHSLYEVSWRHASEDTCRFESPRPWCRAVAHGIATSESHPGHRSSPLRSPFVVGSTTPSSRKSPDPASQNAPRRAPLGCRSGAFHHRPPGTAPLSRVVTAFFPGSPPVETSPPRTVRDASCTPPVNKAF
jgi:hypothetical protein